MNFSVFWSAVSQLRRNVAKKYKNLLKNNVHKIKFAKFLPFHRQICRIVLILLDKLIQCFEERIFGTYYDKCVDRICQLTNETVSSKD